MESPWQEIRRNANWAIITRTLMIHILDHNNCAVEYFGMLVGVYVQELGYDTIRSKLAAQ